MVGESLLEPGLALMPTPKGQSCRKRKALVGQDKGDRGSKEKDVAKICECATQTLLQTTVDCVFFRCLQQKHVCFQEW